MEEYQLGISAHPSDIKDIARGFEAFLDFPKDRMERFFDNSSQLLNTVFSRNKIINDINTLFWGS